MLKRKIELPPEHLYLADEWRIVEARYPDEFVGLTETVFSLGNGFVGVRGSFEEGRPALVPGTFVNGFHETWPITHAEAAHALARTGQTIVNVPDTVPELVDRCRRTLDRAVRNGFHTLLEAQGGRHPGGAAPAQPRARGRDQAAATMTGTLRANHRFPAPVPQLRQARASRQKSLAVRALERPVA
jgi:hypothetical protein